MEVPLKRRQSDIERVLDIIDTISIWAGKIFSWAIIPMFLITIILIIGRHLEGFVGIIGETGAMYNPDEDELPFFTVATTIYFTLGAAFTLHDNGFVNFDMFEEHWSPKTKAIVSLITYTLFFVVFALIFWSTLGDLIDQLGQEEQPLAATVLEHLEGYTDIWTNFAWPIGMFFLLLEGISRYIRNILIVVRGGEKNE